MHTRTARGRVMRRWREARQYLSPAYQERGDAILRGSALGMGQLDEILELLEQAGFLKECSAAA